MVVYDYKNDKSWRIKHNFFHFDPLNGNYNVGGVNFQWTDGVFGMALGNPNSDGYNNILSYFYYRNADVWYMFSALDRFTSMPCRAQKNSKCPIESYKTKRIQPAPNPIMTIRCLAIVAKMDNRQRKYLTMKRKSSSIHK